MQSPHTGRWLPAATGLAFLGLFVPGLVAADLAATSTYPGPSRPLAEVVRYVNDNRTSIRWLAFFHGLAAMAFMLFAVHVADTIRAFAPQARQARLVAVVAGAAAAIFLLLDAVVFWLLVAPATGRNTDVLATVHTLSYLCGGLALTLPLAAFIGTTSWVALRAGFLPRWLAWVGIAAAVEGVAYWATVTGERGVWSPSGVFVTLAVVPLWWIAAVSTALIRVDRARA